MLLYFFEGGGTFKLNDIPSHIIIKFSNVLPKSSSYIASTNYVTLCNVMAVDRLCTH